MKSNLLVIGLLAVGGVTACRAEPGLEVRIYSLDGTFDRVPTIGAGQLPNLRRVVPTLDLSDRRGDFGELQDWFVTVATATIHLASDGWYGFRLTSDDGSLLYLDDHLILDHDGMHGAEAKEFTGWFPAGDYALRVGHLEGGGDASLKLEWQAPGTDTFAPIPREVLTAAPDGTGTAPGKKKAAARPEPVAAEPAPNPRYGLLDLCPAGWEPRVEAIAPRADGTLLLVARQPEGTVYTVGAVTGEDAWSVEVAQVGRLGEPPGRLVADGQVILAGTVEAPTTLRRVTPAGPGEVSRSTAPALWDASSAAELRRTVLEQATLPAAAVGVLAGPIPLAGDRTGQYLLAGGDGNLYRVVPDSVAGSWQGTVFRFAGGLPISPGALAAAGDDIYCGAGPGVFGKPPFGLVRLRPNGTSGFDLAAVRAKTDGLELEFTEPLGEAAGWDPTRYRLTSTARDGSDGKPLFPTVASVSADRRRVFLKLAEMPVGRVVQVRIEGALRSESEATLGTDEAWTTLLAAPENARGELREAPVGQRPNALTAEEHAAGWRLLFDGESFTGWRKFRSQEVPTRGWVVQEGCLKDFGGGGDLVSVESFENFELRIDWRATRRANSGIMYRVTEEVATSWHSGPEIQILDDGSTGTRPTDPHSAGALYELYPPAEGKKLEPAGEWNSLRLVMDHGRAEHWLNGIKLCEYTIGSDDWRARVDKSKFKGMEKFGAVADGHFVLQDHGHEVWFRSIKLRELP